MLFENFESKTKKCPRYHGHGAAGTSSWRAEVDPIFIVSLIEELNEVKRFQICTVFLHSHMSRTKQGLKTACV